MMAGWCQQWLAMKPLPRPRRGVPPLRPHSVEVGIPSLSPLAGTSSRPAQFAKDYEDALALRVAEQKFIVDPAYGLSDGR